MTIYYLDEGAKYSRIGGNLALQSFYQCSREDPIINFCDNIRGLSKDILLIDCL